MIFSINGLEKRTGIETIESKEDTLVVLKELRGTDWLRKKSLWILSEYEEFLKTGKYPYLTDVCKFINERNGLDYPLEGSILSGLVYQASQDYRIKRDKAEGWLYCIPANLDPFVNKQIEFKSSSILGDSQSIRKLVKVGDRYAIMKPWARSRGHFLGYYEQFRPIE